MKLIEICAIVDEHGRITLPVEQLDAAGLMPGDEVCVTLAVGQEDEESDLTLPNTLLEASGIPGGSDLDIVCADGAIVIMEADILDNLPGELRELFGKLGIDPGTVREVMRKEGYFV